MASAPGVFGRCALRLRNDSESEGAIAGARGRALQRAAAGDAALAAACAEGDPRAPSVFIRPLDGPPPALGQMGRPDPRSRPDPRPRPDHAPRPRAHDRDATLFQHLAGREDLAAQALLVVRNAQLGLDLVGHFQWARHPDATSARRKSGLEVTTPWSHWTPYDPFDITLVCCYEIHYWMLSRIRSCPPPTARSPGNWLRGFRRGRATLWS